MTQISDSDGYLRKMEKAFADKAWFLGMIPSDVTTIVDFGCADGSFMDYLRKKAKASYMYFGVEENREFAGKARARGCDVYESLEELKEYLPDRSLLVLSSVLHEIWSYGDVVSFWKKVQALGFKYIAVRDMMVTGVEGWNSEALKELEEEIGRKCLTSKLRDFAEAHGSISDGYNAVHFLLKYFYDGNWERECSENYIPFTERELYSNYRKAGYSCVHRRLYVLKYLLDKWTKDFDILNHRALYNFLRHPGVTTHMRLLLRKDF